MSDPLCSVGIHRRSSTGAPRLRKGETMADGYNRSEGGNEEVADERTTNELLHHLPTTIPAQHHIEEEQPNASPLQGSPTASASLSSSSSPHEQQQPLDDTASGFATSAAEHSASPFKGELPSRQKFRCAAAAADGKAPDTYTAMPGLKDITRVRRGLTCAIVQRPHFACLLCSAFFFSAV